MIFITVGTQFGFDRLVQIVDEWSSCNRGVEIFAQISTGDYCPRNFGWVRSIAADEFDDFFIKSDLIVSHAGMGNIINSLLQKKPIIVMPRLSSLGEHRNDHQLATCNKLNNISGCYIAKDKKNVFRFLDDRTSLKTDGFSTDNLNGFIQSLGSIIDGI